MNNNSKRSISSSGDEMVHDPKSIVDQEAECDGNHIPPEPLTPPTVKKDGKPITRSELSKSELEKYQAASTSSSK